jgi:DNA invertase Pin-like site-specific DNA recombinase
LRATSTTSSQLAASPGKFQGTADANESWGTELDKKLRWLGTRGLPERGDLFKLAQVWVETQRRLWTQLVEADQLPTSSAQTVARLAGDFAGRFLERRFEPFEIPDGLRLWKALGTAYVRYSSPQGNPRSLDDQLHIQLTRAHQDGVFVPWQYVFGDAGVTGRSANRTGYRLCKHALTLEGPGAVDRLYLDDVTRATRDGIEPLLLGHLVETLGKRMTGVSDNFDSSDESSRLKLHFFAMYNTQFMEQLSQKIRRGKNGALRRGTVMGRVPIGIKAVPTMDAAGNPLRRGSGRAISNYAIDETHRPVVELLATKLVDERMSLGKIGKEFNQLRIAGRTAWCAGIIVKILRNHLYVGINIFHRIQHVRDPVTGKITLKEYPRREWKVKRIRETQIFSWKRWKAIQARLDELRALSPKTGKKVSRNSVYPSSLLSGILYCGYFGRELVLYRSDKARGFRQFFCRNGRHGMHGCQLKTSKSARVIEESILNYVRAKVLTPQRIEGLVVQINHLVREEAAKPRTDVDPLLKAASELRRKRERLIDLVADGLSPDLGAIRDRIRRIELEMRELRSRVDEAEAANSAIIPPADLEEALGLLSDLRALLNQDIPLVVPVLRSLLGKVWIRQEVPKKTFRAPWTAEIRAELIPVLADAAQARAHCPDSSPLLKLKSRKWTMATPEVIHIVEAEPTHRQFADAVRQHVEGGHFISDAARALNISRSTAEMAYYYSLDGLTKRQRAALRSQKSGAIAAP